MDNEEFITILSYIAYNSFNEGFDKVIGFFRRNEIITCRLKYKTGLSDFLIKLENEALEKSMFLNSISLTNDLIRKFGEAISQSDKVTKDDLNSFLNINSKDRFRRS